MLCSEETTTRIPFRNACALHVPGRAKGEIHQATFSLAREITGRLAGREREACASRTADGLDLFGERRSSIEHAAIYSSNGARGVGCNACRLSRRQTVDLHTHCDTTDTVSKLT